VPSVAPFAGGEALGREKLFGSLAEAGKTLAELSGAGFGFATGDKKEPELPAPMRTGRPIAEGVSISEGPGAFIS
jgi:hypothetical protein